ncbi:MAG TPA: hypothetical protein VKE97_06270 [Acidimicrobiia bacterium]|nr:hypothetical protein [Acidimicrobiia bacterium]
MRSFELGGTATTTGRRWAARCSCGVVATTSAWPDAIAYLSEHRRATPELRAAWMASLPTPDLRGVAYSRVDVVRPAANGHGRSRVRFLRQLVVGALHSLVRVTIGSFTTSA